MTNSAFCSECKFPRGSCESWCPAFRARSAAVFPRIQKHGAYPTGFYRDFGPGETHVFTYWAQIESRIARIVIEPRQVKYFILDKAQHGNRLLIGGPVPLAMFDSVHHTNERTAIRLDFERMVVGEKTEFTIHSTSNRPRVLAFVLDIVAEFP